MNSSLDSNCIELLICKEYSDIYFATFLEFHFFISSFLPIMKKMMIKWKMYGPDIVLVVFSVLLYEHNIIVYDS